MPATSKPTPGHAFERLVEIMDRLREGCPWDREQTHETLRAYLVEEAAEALEALDKQDWPHFCEELGDLLLQVVFHARLGRERDAFDVVDVVESINRKMVSRHPHVFGASDAKTAEDVLKQWEALKAAEKPAVKRGALKDYPPALPALQHAQKLGEKAAAQGFTWPDAEGAAAKALEEARELKAATTADARDEEFGDLLFALVQWGRLSGLDAEGALGRANAKFRRRYEAMAAALASEGRPLAELSEAEKMAAWERAK